jgi:aryl-alcohol dehydrogenase-like predicted oxidoreductase
MPVIQLDRIGLGTGTLASLGRAASLKEVSALLDEMERLDIQTIDTADSYGSGDCEHLLAKALHGRRDRFHIITKAGYRHGNLPGLLRPLNQFVKKALNRLGHRQCFDISYLTNCLDQSLRRLKTDHVEAFLLHDPPASVMRSPETACFFASIRKHGKAVHTGVSSGDPEVLRLAVECGSCTLIENPSNLRTARELAPVWNSCVDRGIHVVGNHVYEPGCLQLPAMTHERLMRATAALLPDDATILCGTRNPEHLRSSLKWAMDPLSSDEALRLCELASNA